MNKTKKKRISSLLFLAPSLAGLILFWGIPFIIIIYDSFLDSTITKQLVGLDNYRKLFHNASFLDAAKNTLHFSVLYVPLLLVLSLGTACLIHEKMRWSTRFRTVFLFPMMVPVASIILVWQALFCYDGTLNVILNHFGKRSIDWMKSQHNMAVIGTVFLWKNIGYNMILFLAALGSVPDEQMDAIRLETSNKIRIFCHLKLFYLYPALFFVTILSIVNSFKIYRESYLLCGNYPYGSMYMLQNFMNNTFSSMDYPKLASATVVMLVFIVVVAGILFWGENRIGKDLEG